MSLGNKIDFAVIFSVKNANPNGDPLDSNRPRKTYDGLGEVSDVCLKRKMRDRLMEMKLPIFVQSDDNKADEFPSLRARSEAAKLPMDDPKTLHAEACAKWFDVRAFGQVFPFSAKKKAKKTKTDETEDNSSDKGVSVGIRGPVSIQPAFSVAKIDVSSEQIIKSTSLDGDGINRQSDQMGMKHRVDKGVYVFYGSMNPQLAAKTGFSDEDAQAIKIVLPKLFENDSSSARPEGSMRVLKVIWWQHNCPSGQASSAKVHGTLNVGEDGSFTFKSKDLDVLEDGTIQIGASLLKPDIIDGF